MTTAISIIYVAALSLHENLAKEEAFGFISYLGIIFPNILLYRLLQETNAHESKCNNFQLIYLLVILLIFIIKQSYILKTIKVSNLFYFSTWISMEQYFCSWKRGIWYCRKYRLHIYFLNLGCCDTFYTCCLYKCYISR